MAIQKRNIIRVVILFVFALSAVSFRYLPDRPAEPVESPLSLRNYNYIDVYIWRDFLWTPPNWWVYGITSPVPVRLQIGPVTSDFRGVIQVAEAYSWMPINGTAAGFVIYHDGVLHRWEISGTFYPAPDCSLVLVIDEYWFPHTANACGPLVGCVPTSFPAENFPAMVVNVPLNKGYGSAEVGVDGPNHQGGHFHIAVVNADVPDETCHDIYSGSGLP